jgi:hypothetical protein
MDTSIKRESRRVFWWIAALAVTSGLSYTLFFLPKVAEGLNYEVFADELEDVSALAFDRNGDLYATLEMRNGEGQVVHIQQGRISKVLGNLDKPDGILLRDDALYITNEGGSQGLVVYESGRVRYLDGVAKGEGISSADEDKILVVEDRRQHGRLLRIDPKTDEIEVLLHRLKESEGVCQSPGGRIYFVEKALDRLSYYADGVGVTALTGLEQPGYLHCLADGSVLITEDRKFFGRLLRYEEDGVEVLARNLCAPQAVIVGTDGAYYLAEQGKNRILRIYEP